MIINVKKQARSASFLMVCDADARRVAHGTIEVGGSEIQIKASFSFALRSVCTNFRFAQVRLRLGNPNKSKLFFVFLSPCTNFVLENKNRSKIAFVRTIE